ncbi:glutathione S-transferase [Cladochytrium replicatum]|nr:glutathione S-transferase [Cladochytrium replicatum]
MPTYIVHYFDLRARAEVTRLILTFAKADWKNKIIDDDWWEMKDSTPFGQIPLLEEIDDNGKTFFVAQSKAIERYLARKFKLLGADEHEAALIDSISESFVDLINEFGKFRWAEDPGVKEVMRLNFFEKVWPNFINVHTKFLSANGSNGHYVGDEITFADLCAVPVFEIINYVVPGTVTEKSFPSFWKVYETAANHPKLEAYIKNESGRCLIRNPKW